MRLINENTHVPLGWVLGLAMTLLAGAGAVTAALVSFEHRMTKVEAKMDSLVERSSHAER
jgi:hypothetical protein